MSTKINTEYYGAENAFVDLARTYVKRSPYNIGNLFTNGNYTGGALDMSAAPWGIGKSSASSDFQYIAQKGATWTIEKLTRKKGNTPLFIYVNSSSYTGALSNADFVGLDVSSDNYEKALYKCRISPDAEDDGGTLKSTLSIDSGDNVNIANALSNFPITYLNYQHVRLYINHVYYKPVNSPTIEKCTMNDIEANRVDVDYIVYFDCYLSYDSATADTPKTRRDVPSRTCSTLMPTLTHQMKRVHTVVSAVMPLIYPKFLRAYTMMIKSSMYARGDISNVSATGTLILIGIVLMIFEIPLVIISIIKARGRRSVTVILCMRIP